MKDAFFNDGSRRLQDRFETRQLADRIVNMVDGTIKSDVVLCDALMICEFLRTQGTAVYEEVVLPTEEEVAEGEAADRDDIYWDAVHLVIGQRQASISFLQRRLRLGYPKAARFIDMMEQDRIIGPGEGAKPREVLVGPEYLAKRGK